MPWQITKRLSLRRFLNHATPKSTGENLLSCLTFVMLMPVVWQLPQKNS